MKFFTKNTLVPPGWKMVRADAVLEYVKNPISREELNDELFFHYSIPAIQQTGTGQVESGTSIESNKIKIEGGELLVSKLNPEKGTVVLTEKNALPIVCSTELVALKLTTAILPKYAFFFYSSNNVRDYLASKSISATKSHKRVNPSDIYKIWMPLPPLEVQNNLVEYVNTILLSIEKLISLKIIFLNLLAEKRQALITEAVTKGLNPEARMEKTSIAWLGEVPAHWQESRLKYVADRIVDEVEGADFIIAVENIESETGKLLNEEYKNVYVGSLYAFRKGDVVFNKLRPYLAKVYLAQQAGACVGELLVLRSKPEVHPVFLFYRLLSADLISKVDSSTFGAKMPRANWEDFIRNLEFFVPPFNEQKQIIDYIQKNTNQINKLIELTEGTLEILKERRAALITYATMGEIKMQTNVTL